MMVEVKAQQLTWKRNLSWKVALKGNLKMYVYSVQLERLTQKENGGKLNKKEREREKENKRLKIQ